jgi:hypothetical protein
MQRNVMRCSRCYHAQLQVLDAIAVAKKPYLQQQEYFIITFMGFKHMLNINGRVCEKLEYPYYCFFLEILHFHLL